MNMEIGLLDFQSRGGQNTAFPTHIHNSGPSNHHSDFSNFNVGHSSNFNQIEAQNSVHSRTHQPAGKSSWNLEELMTDLSLVYVSGDTERLEGDKLQFCTSTCCSSRVKYARVCREETSPTNPWDRELTSSSTWDMSRQMPSRDMLSGWDLGSDGASTPGSGYNCWSTNTQDSLGVVGGGRMGQLWAGTEFGAIQPSIDCQDHGLLDDHFYEDPEKFDSWGGFEMVGQVEEQGEVMENQWNRIKRKTNKKPMKADK